MKKFSLAGPRQKALCLLIIIFLSALNIISYTVLSFSSAIRIAFLLLSILIIFSYFYVIFMSSIAIDTDNHKIFIRLLRKESFNLKNIATIELVDSFVQNKTVKTVCFYDFNHSLLFSVNTFITDGKHAKAIYAALLEALPLKG